MEVLYKYSVKELQKILLQNISPLFTQMGFVFTKERFLKEYDDGVFGFISILGSSCGDNNTLYFTLHIGLSKRDVYSVLCKLLEKKPSPKPDCLSWKGISDIIPDGKYLDYEWKVKTPLDIQMVTPSVVQVVSQWVLPFFEKNCCKEMFEYKIISGGFANNAMKDWLIPVISYINGAKDKGEDYIHNRLVSDPDKAYGNIIDKVFLENYFTL